MTQHNTDFPAMARITESIICITFVRFSLLLLKFSKNHGIGFVNRRSAVRFCSLAFSSGFPFLYHYNQEYTMKRDSRPCSYGAGRNESGRWLKVPEERSVPAGLLIPKKPRVSEGLFYKTLRATSFHLYHRVPDLCHFYTETYRNIQKIPKRSESHQMFGTRVQMLVWLDFVRFLLES